MSKVNRLLFVLAVLFVPFVSLAEVRLQETAPPFRLKDVAGKEFSLKDSLGKVIVLEWFNRGCPFVQNHYRSGSMQALQDEFTKKGVLWYTVNSTAAVHPDFLTAEQTKAVITEYGMKSTAVLADSEGFAARAYEAKTTPQIYVINAEGKLVYIGAIDDNPSFSGDPKTAKNYARAALEELLAGKPITTPETKPYGCSIKYAR